MFQNKRSISLSHQMIQELVLLSRIENTGILFPGKTAQHLAVGRCGKC